MESSLAFCMGSVATVLGSRQRDHSTVTYFV